MIRVIIADDMAEYRDYFSMLLKNEGDIQIVDVAVNENDVIEKAKKYNPDVILMDIQMNNDLSGIYATSEILKAQPQINIIILSIHSSDENVIRAFEAGAVDFIEKTASATEILNSIRSCYFKTSAKSKANQVVINELVRLKKERESIMYMLTMYSKLSKTEVAILKDIAAGYKYREIAERRCVEEVTIRAACSKICHKLGIKPLKAVIDTLNGLGLLEFFFELDERQE